MREVQDSFNDPRVKVIVGMFSAQMAKTTVIENVLAFHAQHDPSPIMVVLPTLEIAESFSKDRLSPMIRDTPSVRNLFSASGSKTSGDTLLHKKFPGGHVTLAGANSYNSLASRPIRIVIGDEAAKWHANEKGSPFRQVGARVKAFWNSVVAYFSTPTDASPDNEFNQLWEQSDKRIPLIECPGCKKRVVMAFDGTPQSLPTEYHGPRMVLRWEEADPLRTESGGTIRRATSAWFECLECGYQMGDVERVSAVRKVRWFATQEFHGTVGFWGWQALSPFCTPLSTANEWLSAIGSIASMQSAKNETLGLPWKEQGEAPGWQRLFDRVETTYSIGTAPQGVLFLTSGVDVQPDRIEIDTWGWGRGKKCWLVDTTTLYGDVDRDEVWDDLTKMLGTMYLHASGNYLQTRKVAVDTGFRAPRVYDWARKHKFGPVVLVKGGPDSMQVPIAMPSPVEITVQGKRLATGLRLQLLNVGHFKSELYSRLSLEKPDLEAGESYPDGYVHICETGDTAEFLKQFTAEQLVTKNVKGYAKRVWEKVRDRNEALDKWVYARAAAQMLKMDRLDETEWSAMEASLMQVMPAAVVAPPVVSAPNVRTGQQQRPGSGWVSGARSNKGSWFKR